MKSLPNPALWYYKHLQHCETTGRYSSQGDTVSDLVSFSSPSACVICYQSPTWHWCPTFTLPHNYLPLLLTYSRKDIKRVFHNYCEIRANSDDVMRAYHHAFACSFCRLQEQSMWARQAAMLTIQEIVAHQGKNPAPDTIRTSAGCTVPSIQGNLTFPDLHYIKC